MNIATTSIAIKDDASGPLADVVFDQVLDAIYQGRLAPGSVINEVALAQEFGVSAVRCVRPCAACKGFS